MMQKINLSKKFYFFLISLLSLIVWGAQVNAATYYSRATGAFATPATWSTSPTGLPINATGLIATDVFIIQNTHIVTVGANQTVAAITVDTGGQLSIGGSTFTVSGTTTVAGTLTITSNANAIKTFTGLVTINGTGTWTSTALTTAARLIFRGGITNNSSNAFSAGGATFNTTLVQSLSGAGTFSFTTPTITAVNLTNNSNLTVTTTLGGNGTLTNSSSGTLGLSGAATCTITTLTNAGTINRTGTGSISTASANFTNTGTIHLNGTGTITGITNNAAGIINLTTSGNITTINNSNASSTLNIIASPVPTITNLTATVVGNTVNYTGAAQTIKGTTYNILNLLGSNTKSLGANTTTTGTLTVGPTVTLNMLNRTLTLNGNLVNNGVLVTGGTGGVTIAGTATNQTIAGFTTTGTLSMTKTGGTATVTGAITGAALTVNGTGGTLVLQGSNTFSGARTVTAGTLSLANTAALGAAGTTLNLNGGVLNLITDATVNAYNVTVGGNATISSNRATSGAGITHTLGTLSVGNFIMSTTVGINVSSGTAGLTFGTTTLSAATPRFDVATGANLTLGALTGNVAFTKQNNGQITLNTASTRSAGVTTLTAGTMSLGSVSALGTTGTTLTLNGGTLDLKTDATINAYNTTVGGAATILSNKATTASAGITHTLGTLSIGNFQFNIAPGSNVGSGTAGLTFGNTTLSAATPRFDVATGANLTLGALTGNVAFTKQNSGQITLNTASGRSAGVTTLTAGTMALGSVSALGTTATSLVLNGGILDLKTDATVNAYNTTVGGTVTILSNKTTAASAGITHTLGTLSIGNFQLSFAPGSNVGSGTAGLTFGATTLSAATPIFDVATGANLTLGALTGNVAFTKQNSGQITLNTPSTRSAGVTTLSAGTMSLGSVSALGTTATSLVLNGGILDLKTDATVNAYNTTVGGAVTILSNKATAASAGITHTLGTLSIGAFNLTVSGGTNATSGTTGVTFGATTFSDSPTLTITNGGGTSTAQLNVGAINAGTQNLTKAGAGTLNFGTSSITLNALNIGAGTLISTSGTLNLAGDFTNNGTFTHNSGTVNLNGTSAQTMNGTGSLLFTTVKSNNTAGVSLGKVATITTLTIADVQSGSVFNDGGFAITTATTLNLNSGTYNCSLATFPWGTLNAGTGTVNYGLAGAQAVANKTYYKLDLSGSGDKTFASNTTITTSLAISGTAKAALANGTSSTANTLFFSGSGCVLGTWGSTGSSATNKNDTYFLSTVSGIITIASSASCLAPTAPVAGSATVTYNGGVQSATATVGAGETVDWYTASTSGSPTVAPSGTNFGVYTAWAEARNTTTNCVSTTRTQVTLTINKRALTITGAANSKTYDDNTTSVTVPTITSGALQGTDVAAFTQTYDNQNVGSSKVMTPAGVVTDGNSGNNYAYTFVTSSNGTITARPLTITAASDSKSYDSNNSSASVPTITSGTLQGGDAAAFTQTFDNQNAGTLKVMTPSGVVSDGNGGSNYSYTFVQSNNGTITALPLTITGEPDSKDYDGTNSSSVVPTMTGGTLQGTDVAAFSQTFDNKNVGTSKSMVPEGVVNDGNGGNNYTYTYVSTNNGTIAAIALTITGEADSKIYDGDTSSATSPTITSGALQGSDGDTFIQTYDNKNIGASKTLTPSGVVNDGNGGNNYTYTFVPTNNGTITALALTITGDNTSKVYDGNTSSATVPTITSGAIQGSDVAAFTQTYDNQNVGASKVMTPAGLVNDGNGGNNYTYTFVTSSDGTITALPLTVTGAANSKSYDGNTSSATVPTITSGTLQGTDVAAFTQTYDTRNAGAGKVMTPSGVVTDGNGGNNYTYTFVTSSNGTITALPLTITGAANSKAYDGGTTSATVPTITSGSLQPGDAAAFTQTYNNKNAGTLKVMTPAGVVTDGNSGNNYTYTYVTSSNGTITTLPLTITGVANSKTYDGGTTSATVPTITAGSLQPGDVAAFSQTYNNKNVGTLKVMTPAGVVTDGNSGNNYTYTFVTSSNGTITARPLTITGAATTKAYDGGTTSATVPNITSGTLQGADVAAFTQTYDTKNVGASKVMTPAGVVTDGNSGNNYTYTFVTSSNGTITGKALTVTATGPTKIYGTALTAGASGSNFTAVGAVAGEAVTSVTLTPDAAGLSVLTVAGAAYIVTPSAATGTGGFLESNYSVSYNVYNGTVATKALTITADNRSKCFGSTVTFAGTEFTTLGLINADAVASVTLTSAGAAAGAAVGGYTIVPSVAVGTGLANYTIGYVNGTLTVNAIPATPTAGNNGPICNGSTLNLTASAVAGATYSWTGPNGFTSALQNPSIAGATTAATGTYSVTATISGCTGSAGTTLVTVNPNVATPVFSLGVNSARFQAASTVTYTATAANSTGITYSLDATSLSAGNTISSTTGTVTYTSGWIGTSTITATAAGCNGPTAASHTAVTALSIVYYSYQSGNWSDPATWTFDPGGSTGPGSTIPGDNNTVVILSGRTVTLSADVTTLNHNVTINSGGILNQSTFQFTNTLFGLHGGGTLQLASANYPTVSNNSFVTIDGGTTEYKTIGAFDLPVAQTTYYHLVINNSGEIARQVNNLVINGNLQVKNGTYQINDATAVRRQLTINGDVTVDNAAFLTVGTGNTVNGGDTPTTVAAGGTAPFINYYNNETHRIVLLGNFTNNGTVKFTNQTAPKYDAFTNTGAATVYFQGSSNNSLTCNSTTDFYNLVLDKGTDQVFKLTLYSNAYANFRLFGANTAAAVNLATANPDLKKALWIRNGSLVLQGLTVIPSLSEGTIADAHYYIPANGALVLEGAEVIVQSTADDYTEVEAAYNLTGGSNAAYGINSGTGSYSGLSILGKLQVDNGYLSTRESAGLLYWSYASGQFILNGGTVDTKQFHNPEGGAIGLVTFVQNGGNLNLRGRFQTNISYAVPGDLSSATINTARATNGIDGAAGLGTFHISSNSSNGYTMTGGTMKIYDVPGTTATSYALLVNCPTSNCVVTGGTVQLIPTAGTVAADANFLVNSLASFGNVLINRVSSTSTVQLSTNPLVVLQNLTLQSGVFNANSLNVTVGGNYTISSGTTYTTGVNNTIFNGSAAQSFTVDLAAALSLSTLKIIKPAATTLTMAGTQSNITATILNITSGKLDDGGKTISVSGNVYNAGSHIGTGTIALNGTTAQTIDGNGSGIFNNLDLNNTNAAAAPITLLANISITGVLRLVSNKIFVIGSNNLNLSATASLTSTPAFSSTCFIHTNGQLGDGGITKTFSSNSAFTFPVGAYSTMRPATYGYTPAAIGFSSSPSAYGSITVVPVGYEHPGTTTNGQSLTYFWHVKSSGFTGIPSNAVTHSFTYSQTDVVGTEANYLPALYVGSTYTWNIGTNANPPINSGTNDISDWSTPTNSTNYLDADYTAGDNAFGVPLKFYSIASSAWNLNTTWSYTSGGAAVPAGGVAGVNFPGANSIVVIENNKTVNLTANANCASLQIQSGSVLDIYTWSTTASNFGMVINHPGGNGLFRLTTTVGSPKLFTFPLGDFSDFNTNHGTTEYYDIDGTDGAMYILPANVTTYGNLMVTSKGGDNLVLPNNSLITIMGDFTCGSDNPSAWIAMSWYNGTNYFPTVEKTIHVTGNMIVKGGTFIFMDDNQPQHMIVDGNVTVDPGAAIEIFNGTAGGVGGGARANTFAIGGDLINNTTSGGYGGSQVSFRTGAYYCDVTFFGSNSASIRNTGGNPTTIFNKVIVDKGTSQATTLSMSIGGTVTTLTNNWLTLQNGTLQYQRTNPATDFTISTTTPFTIPSTAGLYVNYANSGNRNVLIANSASNTNDLFLNGKLTVVSGNVYVGPTNGTTVNNNDIEYSSGGSSSIEVQGGNLIVNGQIRRNPFNAGGILTYNQTGGSVTINGQAALSTNAKLEVLNSGSSFNMSNGTLTLIRGGGNTFGDLYLRPQTGGVTGGTIQFAPGTSGAQTFQADANLPLNHLTLTGSAGNVATAKLMVSPLVLNGNLTIGANTLFNTNNISTTFNGNFTNSAGTGGYLAGTNLTTFSATNGSAYAGAQSITGATNFYNFVVQPGVSLTMNSSCNVLNDLTLSSGTLMLGSTQMQVAGNMINNAEYTTAANLANTGILMNGSVTQYLSGTGTFGRFELNNGNGAIADSDLLMEEDLALTVGILDINKYLLSLGLASNIQGTSFGSAKMIKTDGVSSAQGVRKFIPSGASPAFVYPLGTAVKYTPATLTVSANSSVGYVRINNINQGHAAVIDPSNTLNYYWEVESSGTTNLSGTLLCKYLAGDVRGVESSYIGAKLIAPGITWSITDVDDPINHEITFTYTGSNNLGGAYTAGKPTAFPIDIPVYTSNQTGNWTDPNIWTQTGGTTYPCPVGGPNGFIVIVDHEVTVNANNCFAHQTTINNKLKVVSPYYGLNLGTVDGNGTLYLESGSMPAGDFTTFLECASNSTLEYGGSGSYSIVADLYDQVPNLLFTGTGSRILPNKDLTICNILKINGPTLDNSVNNRKLTIQGSMEITSGAFNSGTGSNATVSYAGAAAQTTGGSKGNFTGSNAFNNLEINNSSGLSINSGGSAEVKGNLLLTDGLINTTSTATLSITNTSTSCVTPSGGSSTSFVNGPLTKKINQGDSFLFPVGIYKAGVGNVPGNRLMLSSSKTGTILWTAEYKNPNSNSANILAPILGVSTNEYWSVSAAAGSQAIVNINWNPSSDITPITTTGGIGSLRIATYLAGNWTNVTSSAVGDNNNGTVTTSGFVTSTGSDDFTLGTISALLPKAKLDPTGIICGTAGIPITFVYPTAIPFNYLLNYTVGGVAQTAVTVTSTPYVLPSTLPGVYQLTGFTYNSGAGTGVVDAATVTVNASPTTAVAGPDQSSACEITSANLAANTPVTGTGVWSIVSGSGGTLLTPTSPTSQFIGLNGSSYVLRWTISNGTCVSSDDVNIQFNALPIAPSAAATQNFCSPKTVADLTATPPSGSTLQWFSVATGGSALSTSLAISTGDYYAGSINGSGCASPTRTKVTATVNPTPTLVINTPSAVCEGSSVDLTLSAVTDGSTLGLTLTYWTDAGATSSLATPSAVATSGVYFIKGVTAAGCFDIQPVTVTITPLPVATISYTGSPFCSNAGVISVSRTGTAGGTYTASPGGLTIDGNSGAITTATSATGVYTVTYTMAAAGGCSVQTATTSVTVTVLPVATFGYSGSPYCNNAANPSPTFSGSGVAGIFSSTVGLNFVSTATGQINLATSTPGTYTVTNTIAAAGGCAIVTATSTVTITALPSATISYAGAPYCQSVATAQPVTLTGTTGGSFTALPSGLSINATTGAITPSLSTNGSYTVTYTIVAGGGCAEVNATASVTVTAVPVATFGYTGSPYCSNAVNPLPTFSGGGVAGIFSSTSGLNFVSTATGQIDLATSTPGTYTVTNTIAAAGGCAEVTATASFTVTALPVATFSYTGTPYCNNAVNPSPTFNGGGIAGVFSSTAGLSFVSTATGQINLATSTPGTYSVTNTISAAGGCAIVTETSSITINALPAATISYAGSPYCQSVATAQPVTLTGTTGGSFTALPSGLTINATTGEITPSSSTEGTYTITYTMTAGGCTAQTATAPVTITKLPIATFNYSGPYCSNGANPLPTYSGGGVAGIFSSTAGLVFVSTATGQVNLATSTPGTYTVTNTIAAAGGCGPVIATATIIIHLDGSWQGTVDNNWNNAANWDCNTLPSLTTNVLIANGKTPYPILTAGLVGQTKNLTIENSSSLTVTGNTLQIAGTINNSGTFTANAGTINMKGSVPQTIPAGTFAGNNLQDLIVENPGGVTLGGTLNVTGIVTAATGNLESAGFLKLVSSATQTALIDGSGAGEVTGNVKMERYVTQFGYKYFSSPFGDATVDQFSSYLSGTATIPKFYSYDENHELPGGQAMTGWTSYPAGALSPMIGYSANLGLSASPVTITLNGSVNNGDMSATFLNHNRTYTQGFNLAGNPYPSPIDWEAVYQASSNIDGAIYFFDATIGADEYAGTYSSYVNGMGFGTNLIASMQGFFVHVTPASGTLKMNNSVRTNDLSAAGFKSAKPDSRMILRFSASFDEKNSIPDNYLLYFDPQATLQFDTEKDALKLINTNLSVPNLYSITPDVKQLSISGMAEPVDSLTRIPLGIKVLKDGWVNLTAKDISRLPSDINLYLLDKEKNITQDLSLHPLYRVSLKAGEYNQRFALLFARTDGSVTPTPAEKIFTISKVNTSVMVTINLPDGEPGKLYVTNLLGQTVLEREVTNLQTVDISSGISSGVYVVTLRSGKLSQSEKTLIRK